MQVPLELTFRDLDKSPAVEELVREQVAKLDRIHDELIGCHVAVEVPHEYIGKHNPYRVRIDLTLPGKKELVVERNSGRDDLPNDVYVVIRDAFKTAERRLRKEVERLRGDVKHHPQQAVGGIVTKLFREEGYGFIRGLDGEEIYFHANSVLHDDFDRITEGTGVQYVTEVGEEGPQASTVHIVSKPGVRHDQVAEDENLEESYGA